MTKYGAKNFIRIANAYINADINTLEGIEKYLSAWFCFTYNTTLNDDRLLDMTLEELVVLYQMHRIKQNPHLVDQELGGGRDDYEDWLKQEMGEEYISEEELKELMLEQEKVEEEYTDKFPDKITTDFADLQEDINGG